ncbi:GGDEF domain-containing protein [uncultured Desulfuromonas sp.]|uniref:GGDEF domain-containing protein n=1 Tax=uncultured Desulfuromonas sp. TaxID=181013 RepID=UPI002AABFE97|nr:GGDEF domain-containing protein [uncultured Desulfuromonas sp.]
MSLPRIYSIQAKLSIYLFLTVTIMICNGILTVYFFNLHLSSNRFFTHNIEPQIQRTHELQKTSIQVFGFSRELSHEISQKDMDSVYSNLTMVLTQLEELTTKVSNEDSGIDILSLNFLSQSIRSQAQLIFQLKAQQLRMKASQQQVANEIRRDLLEIMASDVAQKSIPADINSSFVSSHLKRLMLMVEQLEMTSVSLLKVDQLQKDLDEVKNSFHKQGIKEQNPEEETKLQTLMNGATGQLEQLLKAKRRSLGITQSINNFIGTLDDLTASLIQLTERYIDGVRAGFHKQEEEIKQEGKRRLNLIMWTGGVWIIILYLLYRRIIVRGFGNRLSLISRAMSHGATDEVEIPLPIKGQDEIANMAKAAEELLKKARKLNILAITDELTQVYNRRYFFHLAERVKKGAIRKKQPAMIMMIDIDHFKQINDTWGHNFGDSALREFAKVCNQLIRAEDLFARYGGEEFILLMPDTTPEQGMIAASRLLKAVESIVLTTDSGKTISMTASAGMAEVLLDEKLDQSIKKADDAVYAAKKSGRNRIEVYRDETDPKRQ